MAERRMFAKTIVDSDVFLDMPLSTQALYFHLSVRADDDGFINSPNKIMRVINANKNDLEILLAKRYILPFDSGVICIKHWKIHNYIQKDRYKPTLYKDEFNSLETKENKSYSEKKKLKVLTVTPLKDTYSPSSTDCIHDVSTMYPNSVQDGRLGKVRLGKVREDYKEKNIKKETRHKYGLYKNVLLSDSDFNSLVELWDNDKLLSLIEEVSLYMDSKGAKYKNFKSTLIGWEKRSTNYKPQYQSTSDSNYNTKWKGEQNFDF